MPSVDIVRYAKLKPQKWPSKGSPYLMNYIVLCVGKEIHIASIQLVQSKRSEYNDTDNTKP